MAKQEIEISDPDLMGIWRQVKGGELGIMEKVLAYDPKTGNYTRLLKFPPGTRTKETLNHDFCEEVYMVEGFLTDIAKGITMKKGYYGCRPVGMLHGPYDIPLGCVTMEIRYQDPEKPIDSDCSLLKEKLGFPATE